MQMVEKSVFASPWNINELFQKRKKAASGYFVCFRILFKWIFHFGKKPLNLSKIHRHDSQCQHWKYSKNIFNAAILRASWEKRSIWDDTFFDSAFSSLSLDTEKTLQRIHRKHSVGDNFTWLKSRIIWKSAHKNAVGNSNWRRRLSDWN